MRLMGDRLMYIRRENLERCIKACAKAHVENKTWVCPMFVNVDRCTVKNEHGVMCRMFKRKEDA